MRNRWPVSIASVSFIAVVATAIVAVWQAREARQESRRATATRDFLIALFDDANPELRGGKDVTARELLIEGEKRLPSALASEPELQAEVLLAIANVWARFGDVEKTIAATQRRSEIFKSLKNRRLHIEALLDEAHLASQIGDISRLKILLKEIENTHAPQVSRSMTAKSLSEFFWLRGWVALTSGNLTEASKLFIDSERYSAAAEDPELEIRAKYGQFQTAIRLGNRAVALRAYQASVDLISKSKLAVADRLHRGFELVTGLYLLGEFVEGWPEMDRLMKTSMSLYGADNPTQEMLQRYWVNWAIQLEKFDDAISWLNKNKISRSECYGEIPIHKERWCLIYFRALAASGDHQSVTSALKGFRKSARALSTDELALINVTEIESLIKRKQTKNVSQRVEMFGLKSAIANQSPTVIYYHSWFRGIVFIKNRDFRSAKEQLKEAENVAIKQFGHDHPRTIQAKIWKTIANIEELGNDIDSKALVRVARGDISRLSRRLGQGHSVVKKLYQVLEKYESPGAARRSGGLEDISAFF
jgi:tetratricopeptide (TPR) repeat protein